ncbi:MAG: hypothetical protein JXM72_10865 [Deltaproteobacteria bacterium]|nr:hypothetical protein [Deltaproteobacteria bacterium]
MLPDDMDFRDKKCSWCDRRKRPLKECAACPKYRKYHLGEPLSLDDRVLCSVCVHRHDEDLKVYCTTNRRFQEGSNEPFECYKFSLNEKTIK